MAVAEAAVAIIPAVVDTFTSAPLVAAIAAVTATEAALAAEALEALAAVPSAVAVLPEVGNHLNRG